VSIPPPRPNPRTGDVWFIQRTPGHPLLAAHIDEASARTVLVRWLDDGAVYPRPGAPSVRFWKKDLRFVERIDAVDRA
jgi:hypothetical protein